MKLNLGENIRRNRRLLDLTQEQLADRLGVSFQSISRWETGATYPDMELLPEMAKLFSVTVDELLGYNESEEKTPYQEIEDALGNALKNEDIEESVRLIRLIRLEYLEDVGCQAGCIRLQWAMQSGAYKNPEVIAEIRRFTEDYIRLGKGGDARSSLIEDLVSVIDDEHLEEVLSQHSTAHADLSRDSLLRVRYRRRRETEKLAELERILWFHDVKESMHSGKFRNHGGTPDYEQGCRCAENLLAVLHAMNETVPDEKYPLTGDGSVDLWADSRLTIGWDYMICLLKTGRRDKAHVVLEDFIGLIEHTVALPNGTELTCRSPLLSGFVQCKENSSNREAEEVYLVTFHTPAERICGIINLVMYRHSFRKQIPYGDDPQFEEAYHRLTECMKNGIQPDDRGCTLR